MTPNSGTSPYITAQDMLDFKDNRVLGQLVRDDNTEATPTQLLTDSRLAKGMSFASGQLESAVLQSQHYAVADLQALQGNSLAYMKWILANLTMKWLYGRRGGPEPAKQDMDLFEWAEARLDDIKSGLAIFAFQEVEAAGNPMTEQLTFLEQSGVGYMTFDWQRAFGQRHTYSRGLPGY
jgi:hypothetical protein